MKENNLDNIKVGDKIIYRQANFYGETVLTTVVRVTPKQFVDNANVTFRKSDGNMVGTHYHECHLATEEEIKKITERDYRRSLYRKISKIVGDSENLSNVPTEEMEAILNILEKYKTDN